MSYSTFNELHPPLISSTDPSACCVGYKYKWLCGGNRNGPDSTECDRLMAVRCSKSWDSRCEIYSRDRGGVDVSNIEIHRNQKMSTGEKFNRNVVMNKFCTVKESSKCKKDCTPFRGDDPDSPIVCGYIGDCKYKCDKFTKKDLSDHMLQKCLDHPSPYKDVLKSFCESARAKGIDTRGTRLGRYCNGVRQASVGFTMSSNSPASKTGNMRNILIIVTVVFGILLSLFLSRN